MTAVAVGAGVLATLVAETEALVATVAVAVAVAATVAVAVAVEAAGVCAVEAVLALPAAGDLGDYL